MKRNIKKKQDGYGMSLIFNKLEANGKQVDWKIKTCCFISILSAHKASVDSSDVSSGVWMAPADSLISAHQKL